MARKTTASGFIRKSVLLGALCAAMLLPWPQAAAAPANRLRNLQKGFSLFFLGEYPKAEAALRAHLKSTSDKYGLAAFLLGATLTARSLTEPENREALLDEGVRRFREARRWGAFRLPDSLKALVSPRILAVYYRAVAR